MTITYEQGITHMQELSANLEDGQTSFFTVEDLLISYPGYKRKGDYRLTQNNIAPRHTDIVAEIHEYTNSDNFDTVVDFLNDIYENGTTTNKSIIGDNFNNKIFWITLQEEINYPQPGYAGRRLPFQRFYEAALIHKGIISLSDVNTRTNNHGGSRPTLLPLEKLKVPSFYI